jgi:cell division septal protein FtsQ
MAKPIKETPVLYDEDAYRFEMAAHNVVPLSEEERAERLAAYEKISKKVSFAL